MARGPLVLRFRGIVVRYGAVNHLMFEWNCSQRDIQGYPRIGLD